MNLFHCIIFIIEFLKEDIKKFERICKRYKRISENHGAEEIKGTYYITREEKDSSHLYENADFSVGVIKNSIKDGELQTNQLMKCLNNSDKSMMLLSSYLYLLILYIIRHRHS